MRYCRGAHWSTVGIVESMKSSNQMDDILGCGDVVDPRYRCPLLNVPSRYNLDDVRKCTTLDRMVACSAIDSLFQKSLNARSTNDSLTSPLI